MRSQRALYLKIADDILLDINNEKLKPNEPLPLQSEYAAAYHTSVGTVKKAYALLKKYGLIKTTKGHGTVVRGAYKVLDDSDSFRSSIPESFGKVETRVLSSGWAYANETVAHELGIEPSERYFLLETIRYIDGCALCFQRIHVHSEPAVRLSLDQRDFSSQSLFELYCSLYNKGKLFSIKRLHAVNCPEKICKLLCMEVSIPVLQTKSRLYYQDTVLEFYESFERTDLCAAVYRKDFSK